MAPEEEKVVRIPHEKLHPFKGQDVYKRQVFDDGHDEAGNPKTKTITYSQIIQVFYTYKTDIPIGYDNFLIYDEAHVTATGIDYINPRPDFSEKTDTKDNYFIVCLKNKSQYICLLYTSRCV